MSLKGGIDGRVKALEEQLADRDAEEAVELALKSGKITPAQKGWAKDYALKSPEDVSYTHLDVYKRQPLMSGNS